MELFKNGLEIDYFFDIGIVTYRYFGRLEEIDFLKRIYDLEKMPSHDSRYKNAEIDIWKHTVNNDDYPPCWVFEDERFQLQNGSDEIYLKFICEIFHPAVRNEKGYWKEFLTEVNKLLQNDGYELYPAKKISNREVYAWRVYKPEEEGLFIPYSQRNLRDIREKKISLSINISSWKSIMLYINTQMKQDGITMLKLKRMFLMI